MGMWVRFLSWEPVHLQIPKNVWQAAEVSGSLSLNEFFLLDPYVLIYLGWTPSAVCLIDGSVVSFLFGLPKIN